MNKIIKWILSSIIILVILVGVAIAGILLFLPPEKVKEPLLTELNDKTKLKWEINGALAWRFFPQLGLELQQLKVSDPAESGQTIGKIGEARVSVSMMSLLHGGVVVDEVLLQDADLDITRWMNAPHKKTEENAGTENNAGAENAQKVLINSMKLHNVTVRWKDAETQKLQVVTVVDLTNKNIGPNRKSPLHMEIQTENLPFDGTNTLELTTTILWGLNKIELQDTELKVSSAKIGGGTMTAKMHAVLAEDNISLVFDKLMLSDSTLEGRANIWPKTKKMTFTADADKLDLDRFISGDKPSLSSKGSSKSTASKESGKLFSADLMKTLRQYTLDGDLKVKQLKQAGLDLENVSLKVALQKGIFTISPASANAYSGQMAGTVRLDLSGDTPAWQMGGNIGKLQVQPFLKDLYHYDRVTGTVEGDVKLHTRGNQSDEVLRGMNGNASFKILSGQLQGIDIGYWISAGKALLNKQVPSGNNSGATEFAEVTASFTVNNGIANTKDFKLSNSLLNVDGTGDINLAKRTIDFHLSASETGNKNGLTIPIIVTGEFGNAHVAIDPEFLKEILTKTIGNQLLKKIEGGAAKEKDSASPGLGGLLQQGLGKAFGQ